MAGKVNRVMAEWLIVGLIVFSLIVEVILHKLEHWIAHRHQHLQSVLRNLYRELMILGMVSFGFILYIFIAEPSKDIKMTFEVAHVFIFLFAVFHTFVVMCTVFMSLRLSARWKTLERMELVKYLEKKEKYRKLCDRMERHRSFIWRNITWWFPKTSRPFRYWKLHEVMSFHDTRFQFIYYRNLPPDFRFSSFLRKIKSATFIELVEIHWTHFLFFLGFVLLDLARTPLNFSPNFEPAFLIAESIFNIVVVSVLAMKIRGVYWKMTKNPATYYDAVDRRAFEEELLIAEEEARIEMESQPASRNISRPMSPRAGDSPPKEGDDTFRKSVDMDRPRTSASRVSTDYPRNQRSKGGSGAHTPGVTAKPHQPIYANMTHAASGHSSGTDTPNHSDLDISAVVARHSLDVAKETTLDLSKVKNRGDINFSNRPSARSSFDKPRSYVPSMTNEDGTMSMDAVSRAALRRRSQELVGGRETSDRVSLDGGRMTPLNFRSSIEGRRVSNVSQQKRRFSTDGRRDSNASRRSIELSETLPTEELATRTANSKNIEKRSRKGYTGGDDVSQVSVDLNDDEFVAGKLEGMSSFRSRTRAEAIRRLQEKKKPTASIVKNARDLEAAKQLQPSSNYPAWVVKILPRLGRVASPAEKLFWFGSHRFFLWCVEWVLFFTTINVSATLAKVGFAIKENSSGGVDKKKTAPAVRFVMDMVAHQAKNPAKPGAAKATDAKAKKPKESFFLLLMALLVAFIALFYVLLRIAGIMKKYIFVLNNANMLPENMTIQAIQTVRIKNLLDGEDYHGSEGSDTEMDENESAQQRRNLSSFFNNEVEGGHMPGVSTGAATKRRISISSRRTSAQEPEPVEAVASHSMDGSATAEAMWQQV